MTGDKSVILTGYKMTRGQNDQYKMTEDKMTGETIRVFRGWGVMDRVSKSILLLFYLFINVAFLATERARERSSCSKINIS
jgi:hypothetical protein